MKNCEIKSPPVFAADVPRWDRETDADGDDMGLVVEQVFNNTIYNKQKAEQALGILLPGRMILTGEWNGLTYTIEHESKEGKYRIYRLYIRFYSGSPEGQHPRENRTGQADISCSKSAAHGYRD